MNCTCGGDSSVTTTRQLNHQVFRRRKCKACKRNFATIEIEVDTPGSGNYNKEGKRNPKPDAKGMYTPADAKAIKAKKVEARRKNEDRKEKVPSYFIEEEDW